ncbi:MAG: nucleoside 2-deoxyribosyltransferase [Gemmatimonadales bacterium]
MKSLVYLAGPITGQSLAGANDWRAAAAEYLAEHGVNAITPLRGKDYLNTIVGADGTYGMEYEVHPMSAAHGITARDRWDCQRSDLVLVNLLPAGDRVSIGTVMEVAWADAARKYVLVVMEPGGVHDHAMLREAASLVLPDLEEALHLVPVILGAK